MRALSADRPQLGAIGEAVAARFLQDRGAVVLARNLVTKDGELDLVVEVDGEVAAVEVRTARRSDVAPELISEAKERQVRRVAAGLDPPILRVDLVTVLMDPLGVRVRWTRRL